MSWYPQFESRKSNLILQWQKLLNRNVSEHEYQTFLTKHAGLFLGNDDCHLIISKLKLGSEFETDFVTLTDGFSNGNVFELIEIKQPGARLFNKNGTPTAEFNRAIQQVRDWKRWLIDNKAWMSEAISSYQQHKSNK